MENDTHPSEQELLLWIDGEISARRAAWVRTHIERCPACHSRKLQLERTIAGLVDFYRRDISVPSVDGPRSLLKARMAAQTPQGARFTWPQFTRAAALCSILAVVALAIAVRPRPSSTVRVTPNVRLTPGATISISAADVCSADEPPDDPAIPDSLKNEVLREYGLSESSASAYEIDYLVTPRLGGTASIRNLWPQPAFNSVWNAHVKDALEAHLHQLVCSRQLDLATAQRDLSRDWIAAYRKYFHTKTPFPAHSAERSRRYAILATMKNNAGAPAANCSPRRTSLRAIHLRRDTRLFPL